MQKCLKKYKSSIWAPAISKINKKEQKYKMSKNTNKYDVILSGTQVQFLFFNIFAFLYFYVFYNAIFPSPT